ncbi:hypothetical protein DCO57_22145 [Labrenzia sp. 011]|nr:hypothetical protein DCO57_22145 [Labrenzia sp. 011]
MGAARTFKWRFEALVEANISVGSELQFCARLDDRSELTTFYVAEGAEAWQEKNAGKDDDLCYAKTGKTLTAHFSEPAYSDAALQIIRGANLMPSPKATVLLVVHNLNAIERGEKRRALNTLRRDLNTRGVELIVLHHSKSASGCDIPEINFFDPELTRLSKDSENSLLAIDPSVLDYAQRMLYGFTFALNRRPKNWGDIEKQILDEGSKVSAAVKAVQPSLVLLWHQWNSLMILARAISDGLSIPSAIMHEGMLPGTMTIDEHGMMAESSALGALLLDDDDDNRNFLERADRVIAEIKGKKLDRKPFEGTPAGKDVIQNLKARGARTVFYAGINDWQSGNLPADHSRAKIHSPYFQDTDEGLKCLLDVAEESDFYVVYKPHPNLFPRTAVLKNPRLIYVREANATECIMQVDVMATILSSLAYISLAHGVPTVLMGRNTLSETGAAYELNSKEDLSGCLNAALKGADSEEKKICFRRHVAALLKSHLYPYGGKTDFAALSEKDSADRILQMIPNA